MSDAITMKTEVHFVEVPVDYRLSFASPIRASTIQARRLFRFEATVSVDLAAKLLPSNQIVAKDESGNHVVCPNSNCAGRHFRVFRHGPSMGRDMAFIQLCCSTCGEGDA